MKTLLDSHVFLWAATDDSRLSRRAKELLASDGIELYLSVASLWELTIKPPIGKLPIPGTIQDFLTRMAKTSLIVLPVQREHVFALSNFRYTEIPLIACWWHKASPSECLCSPTMR